MKPVIPAEKPVHFIRKIIADDVAAGRTQVLTRFPPEPNGYLHIGHAKSICLNFSMADEFGGACNLRFDDTNPEKEEHEFIESIQRDVKWLGFEWHGEVRFTSSYFDQLYEWAVHLIKQGKAYVCHLSPEDTRIYRGTLTEPGKDSPYRNRSVEENLALLEQMKNGALPEGACVLRAKIDMAAPNINLRDPAMYRIRHATHHQTGDKWKIYPTYDFAHGQSDAIEGISHSICTLEFEDHRPLYEWFLNNLPITPPPPRQYEFARLNLNYTVMSKRKLKQLVDEKHVSGWDDPRMPTISGLRRRGYTAEAVRNFCELIGVTRSESVVDVGLLEFAIRDVLDKQAPRAMCVLAPLKVVLTNFPADTLEHFTAQLHPQKPEMGTRELPFSRELYIDRSDFRETAEKDFKRLVLGQEVRLRNAYVIRANEVIRDANGEIVELRCTYDPETRGKNPDGRKVKGVIHWVSAAHSIDVEVRLYDRLFSVEAPEADKTKTFLDFINPQSLTVLKGCKAEPSLAKATPDDRYQFEREGYFCADNVDSRPDALVFNRTIGLRDSFGK